MVSADGRNIGRTDRIARLVVGLVLVSFALLCPWAARQGATVQWVSGLLGGFLALSGMMAICPIYAALGVATRRRDGDG